MRHAWILAIALAACSRADGEPRPTGPTGPTGLTGPIVVELFTSQGCSSCPPADRLLAQLAKDATIAPLAFHVDYWDDLGWPDPYARAAWTERQRQYAHALGDERVYTPELVVGGAKGVVGSNKPQVLAAIGKATAPALLPVTATWTATKLELAATAPADADVFVAIYEQHVENKVARGENAGETLGTTRVVRRFERVAQAGKRGSLTLPIDPAWRSVGALAFAQRADRVITASALVR